MAPVARNLSKSLREWASYYPVVTLTGPRQSGKTTLCREVFPEHAYVNLEAPDAQQWAREDPRGFLAEHRDGAVLDEIQNVPDLVSYLQEEVDLDARHGRFVLTGSQHFALSDQISQSLAGRTAVGHLLPLSYDELQRFDDAPTDLWDAVWRGGYPRIFDQSIPPARWYADYVATYVQRDVRQLANLADLSGFTAFMRLVAGRTGNEINYAALGGDAGVSHNTAKAWLSLLETSFLILRLPAWSRTVRTQVRKAHKLHLIDTGLCCYLIGITEPGQLRHHPLRGALFESWVAAEIYKSLVHSGRPAPMFHYRDAKRLEVDLIVEEGDLVRLVECKSGTTIAPEMLSPLHRLTDAIAPKLEGKHIERALVYGGRDRARRQEVALTPWPDAAALVTPPDDGSP